MAMHKKNCKATLLTDTEGCELIKSEGTHEHPVSQNLHREYISNSVKVKAVNNMSVKPARMVLQEIQQAPSDIRNKLTTADSKRAQKTYMQAEEQNVHRIQNLLQKSTTSLKKLIQKAVMMMNYFL